jgi:hypothetical protein
VEISWKKFALFFEHASSSVAPTISMTEFHFSWFQMVWSTSKYV